MSSERDLDFSEDEVRRLRVILERLERVSENDAERMVMLLHVLDDRTIKALPEITASYVFSSKLAEARMRWIKGTAAAFALLFLVLGGLGDGWKMIVEALQRALSR